MISGAFFKQLFNCWLITDFDQNLPTLTAKSWGIMFLANSLLFSVSLGASTSFPESNYRGICADQNLKKILETTKFVTQFLWWADKVWLFFLFPWQLQTATAKPISSVPHLDFKNLKKPASVKFVKDRKLK